MPIRAARRIARSLGRATFGQHIFPMTMVLSWLFASVHLLALGIGLGAVFARARALRSPLDPDGLRRIFLADNLWGLAAILWLGTGLPRAFMGLEKGAAYYLHQPVFHTKMALFVLIVVLEIWPARTLVGWRRGRSADPATALKLARISQAQAVLIILMVFAAAAMARGLRF
jgi:putative membrane protein